MREQPVVQADADARRVARVVAVRVDLVAVARHVAREAVVVDAGPRPIEGATIYDLAAADGPVLVRERLGPPIPELDLVVA